MLARGLLAAPESPALLSGALLSLAADGQDRKFRLLSIAAAPHPAHQGAVATRQKIAADYPH
jgi:hypothetical protein